MSAVNVISLPIKQDFSATFKFILICILYSVSLPLILLHARALFKLLL